MEKKYLVKFNYCEQVSPDDFEMKSKEKLFDETATIKEIRDWAINKVRTSNKDARLFEVKLSQPD